MVSYTNETKVKDIPGPSLELEIKELLKVAIFDFGSEMRREMFDHTVNRLTYLINLKYKGLMLGEVKYVFEAMVEHIKGKLSVSAIMQLFARYMIAKIERQRQLYEELEIENIQNSNALMNSSMGSAIIYKMNLHATGQLSIEEWDSVKIKDIAEKIKAGELVVRSPKERKRPISI